MSDPEAGAGAHTEATRDPGRVGTEALGKERLATLYGERGTLTLTPQAEEGTTYATKISKDETRIDWSRPWRQVHDHIRGLSPFPGAWFELPGEDGKLVRVKVLRTTKGEGSGKPGTVIGDKLTIACGDGAVRILQLQRAGGKAMSAEEFLRGTPLPAGTRVS